MSRWVPWIAVIACASAGTAWSDAAPSSGSDELATDLAAAESAARGGSCERSRELGARVKALDPAYFQRAFVADPAIAACLATGTAVTPALGVASEPPPLSGPRISLELLAGVGMGTLGAALGFAIGQRTSPPCHGMLCTTQGEAFGALAGYALTIPLGVAVVGDHGDEHGSLSAAYLGSVLGAGIALLTIPAHHNDPTVLAAIAGPPLGAIIGFNLTRAYDAGAQHAPSWVPTASAGAGGAMFGIAGRF